MGCGGASSWILKMWKTISAAWTMHFGEDGANPTLSHFTMSFDTSPVVLKRLGETLRADPLVVRCVHAFLYWIIVGMIVDLVLTRTPGGQS